MVILAGRMLNVYRGIALNDPSMVIGTTGSEFCGEHERSAFERYHLPVPCPAPFGEYHERHPVLEPRLCLFDRVAYARDVAVVYKYLARLLAGPARPNGIVSSSFFISHLKLWFR